MLNIIPLPCAYEKKYTYFKINSNIIAYATNESLSIAEHLIHALRPCYTNFYGKAIIGETNGYGISFKNDKSICHEGYKIDINEENIIIRASGYAGFMYAYISLIQLLPLKNTQNATEIFVDSVEISDSPLYSFRSYMLDEARHFFGEEEVKRILDIMAIHKLNKFHWHLSDDQGFRLQIDKYPLLTEVGSARSDTQIGGWHSKNYNGVGHKGFYTKEQIKNIINYAKKRNIEIIPEFNMPGHFTAIIAAYPEFGCNKEKIPVATSFGVKETVACVGNKELYNFLFAILDEFCELFPSQYFHLGGNEVPYSSWEKCETCSALLKVLGLSNYKDLQVTFINAVSEYLNTKGKTTIIWNDIACKELNNNIIIQYNSSELKPAVATALQNGYKVIVSKTSYTYLDMPYASVSLNKIYNFNPCLSEFNSLDEKDKANIIGAEACMWTEWVYDREKLDFNAFPRLTAFSEVIWSSNNKKNINNFIERLKFFQAQLAELKINFAKNHILFKTSKFRKWRDLSLFSTSDQYSEVRRNRKD